MSGHVCALGGHVCALGDHVCTLVGIDFASVSNDFSIRIWNAPTVWYICDFSFSFYYFFLHVLCISSIFLYVSVIIL